MYSQLVLPHSIVIYCIWFLNGLHVFQGSSTGVGCYRFKYGLQEFTLTGNTTGNSGVAAESAEFLQFPHWCFPIQGSVYSLLSLLEDQALKLLCCLEFVLSYSGLGLLPSMF